MNADEMEAGPETDALVAEYVMGWKRLSLRENNGFAIPEHQRQRWMIPVLGAVTFDVPKYSADIAVTWEMEERIEQRGLNLRYTQELMAVFLFDGFAPEHDEELWWALVHASPSQRCHAALKAVQNER